MNDSRKFLIKFPQKCRPILHLMPLGTTTSKSMHRAGYVIYKKCSRILIGKLKKKRTLKSGRTWKDIFKIGLEHA